MSMIVTRRTLLLGTGATMLAGCDRLAQVPSVRETLFTSANFHQWSQRALTDRNALAKEFAPEDRSPLFRANGTRNPNTDDYKAHWRTGFADWRVRIDGLVARPLALSLADLRAMPQRVQTTRHDCVEGWSAIGTWTGVPLALLLKAAGLRADARFLVFHCADRYGSRPYYESVDLIDAFHPQTILAHMLNEAPLTVANGAPVRLRVERQLGYKQAKYVTRIEAVASLTGMYGGKGGYWEDVAGYDWYAGI